MEIIKLRIQLIKINTASLFPFLLQLHKLLLSIIFFEVEALKLKHSDRWATGLWASTEHKAASTFQTP